MTNLKLNLHNWRIFQKQSLEFPNESFLIFDTNGSGKTSLIAALYSLLSSQSWPGTKLNQNLRVGENYFGVSTNDNSWSLTGQISPSGRLVTKYEKPENLHNFFALNSEKWPKVLTYLPTDNYWFAQSRTSKLSVLDNLLGQVYTEKYSKPLAQLEKLVKSKASLIKLCQEDSSRADMTLVQTLSQQIYLESIVIWNLRIEFWKNIQTRLSQFSDWIESPLKNWRIEIEISLLSGQKSKLNLENYFLETKIDEKTWLSLWPREMASGKVLFGAQRDDFSISSNHLAVENVLSRGEMRLLVLFIKNLAREYLKASGEKVFWLLDDVFNEFDDQRESLLVKSILADTDYFVATSTKKPLLGMLTKSISDLTIS